MTAKTALTGILEAQYAECEAGTTVRSPLFPSLRFIRNSILTALLRNNALFYVTDLQNNALFCIIPV